MENVPERLVVEEDRDWWPVVIGSVLTMAFLTVSYFAPALVPYESLQDGLHSLTGHWYSNLAEPFESLRFAGGFVGGVTAGYLTSSRLSKAATRGAIAALLGITLVYMLYVGYNLVQALLAGPVDRVPFFSIFLVPFVFLVVQLGPIYLVEGLVAGWAAGWLGAE